MAKDTNETRIQEFDGPNTGGDYWPRLHLAEAVCKAYGVVRNTENHERVPVKTQMEHLSRLWAAHDAYLAGKEG